MVPYLYNISKVHVDKPLVWYHINTICEDILMSKREEMRLAIWNKNYTEWKVK